MTTNANRPVPVDARPALTRTALNAIAAAITPNLMAPFVYPARTISLGTAETFGIRPDYQPGTPGTSRQPSPDARVARLAEQIAHALGSANIVWTHIPDRTTVAVNPHLHALQTADGQTENAVVVCADILQWIPDPALALADLRTLLSAATLALVTVPLRPLTMAPDSLGPPEIHGVVREWTFPEFQTCLELHGMEPLFGGVLLSDAPAASGAMTGVIVASTCPLA